MICSPDVSPSTPVCLLLNTCPPGRVPGGRGLLSLHRHVPRRSPACTTALSAAGLWRCHILIMAQNTHHTGDLRVFWLLLAAGTGLALYILIVHESLHRWRGHSVLLCRALMPELPRWLPLVSFFAGSQRSARTKLSCGSRRGRLFFGLNHAGDRAVEPGRGA